jgi:hypothetical protein
MAMARTAHLAPKMKHRFTEEEDTFILRMVNDFGVRDWSLVAKRLGTRTARQCRERWGHYLHPVIDIAPRSPEEDALLQEEYKLLGPKWSQISSHFPGRTAVNLKNRWARLHRNPEKLVEPSAPEIQATNPEASTLPAETEFAFPQFAFPRVVEASGKHLSPIECLLPAADKRFPENAIFHSIIKMPDRL